MFLYMRILPQVYTHCFNFFLSVRVAVNGHSYLHYRCFCICAFFLKSTSTFLICFLSARVAVNGHSYLHFGFFCICASIIMSTPIFLQKTFLQFIEISDVFFMCTHTFIIILRMSYFVFYFSLHM